MIEDISNGFFCVYDIFYDTVKGACIFTGRVALAAYTGIANIASLFFYGTQSSKELAGRVEESTSRKISLEESLASYINTLSLEPYIPKGANFQITGSLNIVHEVEDSQVYFIKGKFDFDDRTLNAMISLMADKPTRVCTGFAIDYITNGPLLPPALFFDIVQSLSEMLPEATTLIKAKGSLIYIMTEEFEGKREQVWTLSKSGKTLSVAITLYDSKDETTFVIHDPRNQMVSEIKKSDSV